MRAPEVRALPRDRLHDLLGRLWHHRLGLVVAPAGSGKTTLLAQFAASTEVPVAWYRAEASDATEESFLAHLERSANGRFSGLEGGWRSVEDMIAAIERWHGRGGLIVVDEIDALWGTEAEDAVERLVDYLPPGWAILSSARRSPGLNLSRLRVNGHLLEIGPEELRFRFWEVERLFRDFYGEPLPPDQLAELTRRTEGWAAGLQLFHLATRGQPARERQRLLTELGRRSRLMREYLATNVIDQLPADLRTFLVDTSVLGRLTPHLCDAVTGRSDSASVLAELEQARLFTHRTDSGAFRYHEVLRSHLEASLIDTVGESVARDRFRAAGGLLESEGAVPDALRAYGRAEDWDAVLRLLGGRGEEAVDAAGDWIDLLPSALMDQDPWLLLGSARRYVSTGRWGPALDAYQRAETLFGHGQSAELCRRERTALSAWLEPVAVPASDWTGALRAATRREPAAAVRGYAASTRPEERLAEAVGLLIAGDVRRVGAIAAELESYGRLSPVLSLATDLVATLAAMLGGAPVVIELDRVGERADALGVPWLASLARGLIRGTPGVGAADQKGDPWAPPLIVVLAALRTLLAGGRPSEPVDDAADELRRLGAPALESWARSVAALVAARAGRSGSVLAARDAEIRARTAEVPGSLAVALSALAVAEPDQEAVHLAAARAIGDQTGIDIWRLIGPRRSSGQPPTGRSRVVGREREQAELRAYVDGVVAGRGRTVLLSGPSGIGKTRLAEDVAEYAVAQGAEVLWGQATPGAGPYWVWGQMVRAHLMGRDLVDDPVRLDSIAALSRLVPELPELLPLAPLDVDAEVSQQEVFDSAAAFFGVLAARSPLLLVVDDLHAVDATSLHLFDFLSRVLVQHRVVLLGAHQDAGAGLATLTSASRVRLGGLSTAGVHSLVADATMEQPAEPLVAALAELTGGNPFFVLEIARTLAAEKPGRLAELGRGDLRLPPSLRELALGRLEGLSEHARRFLDLAAVVGRTFGLVVLEAAAGEDAKAVLAAVGEARTAGLIEEDGPAPGLYRFTHGILQEALYEAQTPAQRATLHNRIGDAIEEISAPMLDARVPELAHHLLLGASTGDRARAAAYGRRAAAQALDHAAYEDAVSWATTALEALSGVRGHTELRRRLLDLSAQAESALGDDERAAGLRAAAASLGEDPTDDTADEVGRGIDRDRGAGRDLIRTDDAGARRQVTVRCFGRFELVVDGTTVDLRGMKPRVRSLLRLLSLRAGEAVHREHLVDALWPGSDLRTGTRSLHTAISSLRQHLEPGVGRGAASVLVREGDAYRLVLGDQATSDVAEFEQRVRAMGDATAPADAVRLATEALELYRGNLLEEEGPAEWVAGERDRLRVRAGEVAEAGARSALAAGDHEAAVRLVELGLAADRYRDGLWRALIDQHEARGERAAAARANLQYREVLAELGVADTR